MITIEDLYREDVTGNIIAVRNAKGELRGPCPIDGCGGEDRFGVFTQQQADAAGSFFCGHGHQGKGCGKGGDIIEYLKLVRGMSYIDACHFLGREPKGGGKEYKRMAAPVIRRRRDSKKYIPAELQFPDDVENPSLWQEKGMDFVDHCHDALLSRPASIAYLYSRGITMEAIKKFKLGYHAGETRNNKSDLPAFRPWKAWGMRDVKNPNGKPRMLVLPVGIVIPYMPEGNLHRITIRLAKIDPKYPKKKYHYVVGSIRDLWITNPRARAFVTAEAELDCIAIDAASGDLVGTVGIGTTGIRPDSYSAAALQKALVILGSLDFDRAGRRGGKFWTETYPQYKRWPVPVGKDPGEFFEAGGDLRMWVNLGLPNVLQDNGDDPASSDDVVKPEIVYDELDNFHDHAAVVQPMNDDLAELKELLAASGGYILISGYGTSVTIDVSSSWGNENKQRRNRLSELVYQSEQVGYFIENVADGIYGAERICS